MGRAITIASILVFCSFAFVFYQLSIRRPAAAAPSVRGPAPLLEPRADGSIYAVSVDMEKLEKRLMDEEKRWVKLDTELEAMRKDREALQKTIDELQGEVRRLRRQVAERNAAPAEPRSTLPPATAPNGPPPAPVDGVTPGTLTPGR